MNRRNVVRLALAAALFGAAIPAASQAQTVLVQAKWWTPNQQSQRYQDRFHRDMFEGRWLAQDRFDTDIRGNFGGGGRAFMLPDFLNIDQSRRMVTIADRRNNLIQLIAIDNGFHGRQSGATVLQGDLNGNRLVANGAGPRGQQMKQVMILQNHGNTLVVRTQVQRGNRGRIVEVEKVYQRA